MDATTLARTLSLPASSPLYSSCSNGASSSLVMELVAAGIKGPMRNSLLLFAFGYRGFLILLVLGDQIVHVALCLSKLHLIHALARVPM